MEPPTEALLAEYRALREELLSLRQIQTAVMTAALTILAAVGGVALTKKSRPEILLILPFVLSGLGVITVQCMAGVTLIGAYTREHLWNRVVRLPGASDDPYWEGYLHGIRSRARSRFRFTSAVAPVLVLIVPSVAALGIEHQAMTNTLWPVWWGGVIAIALFLGVAKLIPRGPANTPEDEGHSVDGS